MPDYSKRIDELLEQYGLALATDGKQGSTRMLTKQAILSLLSEAEVAAVLQVLANIWVNFEQEVTKGDLSSDRMPKGFRKLTDKEILATVMGQEEAKFKTNQEKESWKD